MVRCSKVKFGIVRQGIKYETGKTTQQEKVCL
jgi:hypothetical protein